jgi:hypothetical protein
MNRCLVLLVALFVLLLAAPFSFASVGKQSYEGPVASQGADGRSPTVRVKVDFKKVHHRRGAPRSLILFAQRAVAVYCSNGQKTYAGPGTELDGGPGGFDQLGDTGQRIRKGKFSASGLSADGGDTQTITGHVSKKGKATGTIRIVTFNPFYGQCDSGVVTWSASPVAAFTPVVQPPCAFQGTCPRSARGGG